MSLTDIVLQYNQKFDTGFPTITFSPDKAIEIMQECIKKGKDAYELGYITVEDDIQY